MVLEGLVEIIKHTFLDLSKHVQLIEKSEFDKFVSLKSN
jgi:hypothetical protein